MAARQPDTPLAVSFSRVPDSSTAIIRCQAFFFKGLRSLKPLVLSTLIRNRTPLTGPTEQPVLGLDCNGFHPLESSSPMPEPSSKMALMKGYSEPGRVESPTFGASSRDRILQAAKSLFATKGYENTSTVAISRAAGSSESQLMKHFGSKEGLLEAIFDESWQRINRSVRQAIRELRSPSQKFSILGSLVMAALERDPELKLLMLLEGRRVRKEGRMVALSQGYLEFVRIIDDVLAEMREAGQLRADLNPEAVRSALMGMLEGLMRDQLLARRAGYPAHYSSKELMEIFGDVLESFSLPSARIA